MKTTTAAAITAIHNITIELSPVDGLDGLSSLSSSSTGGFGSSVSQSSHFPSLLASTCPFAGIVATTTLSPHSHTFTLEPASVHVASYVTVQSPYVCSPVAGIFLVSFSPQAHRL